MWINLCDIHVDTPKMWITYLFYPHQAIRACHVNNLFTKNKLFIKKLDFKLAKIAKPHILDKTCGLYQHNSNLLLNHNAYAHASIL